MQVPFVDLKAQYQTIAGEVDEAMHRVVVDADFILGADVQLFENEFASYCEAKYAVGVDNGISALELTLRAYGIGTGDEVITVAHTFIATVSSISFTGARPIFVDVDPVTYTMDAAQLEAAITPRSKAILPVHLYGQAADMDKILSVARRHNLVVIEDACQSHGARYKGRRVGGLGDAGCFSFYPGKNLGAFGDGGMMVTSDSEIAQRVRMLRNYGQSQKYHHTSLAYNRRLDTLQAAVLRVKLRRLDEWNESRRNAARAYHSLLRDVDSIVLPEEAATCAHVYHLFVIQHPRRDALLRHLGEKGVSAGLHYPTPVHQQPCYEDLGEIRCPLPVTESLAARVLSLPMFPEIGLDQLRYVCQQIVKCPAL